MSISSVHLVAHYQELKVPTVVKKLARCLPVGDFLWLLKSGSEERLLGTIVERKTWTDLVQSIWDGRYYEQLNRMLITRGLTRVIYIIEGTVNDDRYSNLVKNAVRGLEARGVEVVRLNDIYETGRFLDQISTAFQSAQPSVDTLVGYDHQVRSDKLRHT
jgi:ERCC4-type nuclease